MSLVEQPVSGRVCQGLSASTPGPSRSSNATRRPETARSKENAVPVTSGPSPIDTSASAAVSRTRATISLAPPNDAGVGARAPLRGRSVDRSRTSPEQDRPGSRCASSGLCPPDGRPRRARSTPGRAKAPPNSDRRGARGRRSGLHVPHAPATRHLPQFSPPLRTWRLTGESRGPAGIHRRGIDRGQPAATSSGWTPPLPSRGSW